MSVVRAYTSYPGFYILNAGKIFCKNGDESNIVILGFFLKSIVLSFSLNVCSSSPQEIWSQFGFSLASSINCCFDRISGLSYWSPSTYMRESFIKDFWRIFDVTNLSHLESLIPTSKSNSRDVFQILPEMFLKFCNYISILMSTSSLFLSDSFISKIIS